MSMTPSRRKLEAYRLEHAAADGRAIVYRCGYCRRVTTFLATDVLPIWGADMKVYERPNSCGVCGKHGYMSVRLTYLTSADYGTLKVRRPAGIRTVQLWVDEMYGPGSARGGQQPQQGSD